MTVEFDPTEIALLEITKMKLPQKEVSKTLAMVIQKGNGDWKRINKALVERWKGKTARERILTMAWNIVEGKSK